MVPLALLYQATLPSIPPVARLLCVIVGCPTGVGFLRLSILCCLASVTSNSKRSFSASKVWFQAIRFLRSCSRPSLALFNSSQIFETSAKSSVHSDC
ncbi:hypothetical protein BpHYR1_004186 [Brachionus plicatilis]|uniref:Uncharacterized protein n=1 Tax=Brachionus plicatilis TaxID=10195 RepID=A0A3M7SBR8_BRAPC|nr:hypothetical protein BpHYR1_004186 [Brachionus plicatilis]